MQLLGRGLLVVGMSVVAAVSLRAQMAPDPSGHWEGTVQAPETIITFHIDIAKNDTGALRGTISIPAQGLKGLPLAKVAVEGTTVTFGVRADQLFKGILTEDSKSIAGDFNVSGFAAPFSMTRTGDAIIQEIPSSPRISKELEGTWNGTLGAHGKQIRLVLKMTNQPDGTSRGSVINLDEGGLELPIVITHEGSTVTLESTAVKSSFSGELKSRGHTAHGHVQPGTTCRSDDLRARSEQVIPRQSSI